MARHCAALCALLLLLAALPLANGTEPSALADVLAPPPATGAALATEDSNDTYDDDDDVIDGVVDDDLGVAAPGTYALTSVNSSCTGQIGLVPPAAMEPYRMMRKRVTSARRCCDTCGGDDRCVFAILNNATRRCEFYNATPPFYVQAPSNYILLIKKAKFVGPTSADIGIGIVVAIYATGAIVLACFSLLRPMSSADESRVAHQPHNHGRNQDRVMEPIAPNSADSDRSDGDDPDGSGSASHPLFDRRTGADYARKYKFVKLIGEGVFSKVFLVKHRRSRSGAAPQDTAPMAMKVIQCSTDDEIEAAFTEYLSMRRLQGHPNIVVLVDMSMTMEDLPEIEAEAFADDPAPASEHSGSDRGSGTSSPAKSGARGDSFAFADRSSSPNKLDDPAAVDLAYSDTAPGSTRPKRKTMAWACLLMKYYPDGTLEAGIKADPAYFRQPGIVRSFLEKLLMALTHSHSKGIVHLDMKPGNVLLKDNRQNLVVSDFGLARVIMHDEPVSNIGGGTLYYQAPEQLERRSSKKSDVWGLACTVTAMVTGRVGAQTVPMFYWHAEADFEKSFTTQFEAAGVPRPIVKLLLRMLNLNVDKRPTMEECLEKLRAVDQSPPLTPDASSTRNPTPGAVSPTPPAAA